MNPSTRIPLRLAPRMLNGSASPAFFLRPMHSTATKAANVAPTVGTGPPPEPPMPAVVAAQQRLARRRKQAEMIKQAKELRSASAAKSGGGLKRRFWKDVRVEEVDGSLQVFLDTRPLRHPATKAIIRVPVTKPDLALALALEWDLLTSAQDATRQHLIPLTSLVCRALDLEAADAAAGASATASPERIHLANTLLKYLDTDSILCWAPPAEVHDIFNDAGESLRDVQKRTADDIVSFLTTHVWPGVTIKPVLDGHSIFPQAQEPGVREVVQGWITGLDAFELAGLERAVLAGKSLLAGARFVTEWSEGSVGKGGAGGGSKFGVEDAAVATSLEVDWQTGHWGEVEDTHDVNKEDVRRQLGSVALLVAGTGKKQ